MGTLEEDPGPVTGDRPLVTVNVLTHNRRATLERTLHALNEELTYPRERLEFIVVDNGSTDGTPEMVHREFPGVRVIENDNVGAAGWTRGFRTGRGDYFLILDDDCYLTGDALDRAVRAAQARAADLVSFRVISALDRSYEFTAGYRVGLLSFWACAALISRSAVERLGGFDPAIFIWGNELEFTIRLLDAGFRHLFAPDVTALHIQAPPATTPAGLYLMHTRHMAYVAAKLLLPGDAAMALLNLAVKATLDLVRDPRRGGAVRELLRGARAGIRRREPVRQSVSRLYRHNFREFTSPLPYLCHPVALWRAGGEPGGLKRYLESRHRAFYRKRPSMYPTETASLLI